MSKKELTLDPRQADLPFYSTATPIDSCHLMRGMAVMEKIKALLKVRNKSIEEMAEWMSDPERRPKPVSVDSIRTWFAPTKPSHWPNFLDLLLMCEFLGSQEPLESLVAPLGLAVIGRRDQQLLQAGRTHVDEMKLEIRLSAARQTFAALALEEERGGLL